jgi:hypothetical protein
VTAGSGPGAIAAARTSGLPPTMEARHGVRHAVDRHGAQALTPQGKAHPLGQRLLQLADPRQRAPELGSWPATLRGLGARRTRSTTSELSRS